MHDRFMRNKRAREQRIKRRQSRYELRERRRSTRLNSNANS